MNSINKTARMAGFLYLIYMVTTILADVLGRSKFIVYGDAAATANKIMASGWAFRNGVIGDLISAVLFLLAAWALYVLLQPVNKNLALLFLLLNLGGVVIQCVSDLHLIASLLVLSGADYLKVFQAGQLQALAMLFLYVYKNGYMIAQLFYGAWLFPLGFLVFKSGYLPRILGMLLMVECFCWLIYPFQFFLFPGYEMITNLSFAVGFIGEASLTLWLLLMGAREQK